MRRQHCIPGGYPLAAYHTTHKPVCPCHEQPALVEYIVSSDLTDWEVALASALFTLVIAVLLYGAR